MVTGRILQFDHARGYGFVAADDGGEDVFLHASVFDGDPDELAPGTLMEFKVMAGDRGRKGFSAHLIDDEPATDLVPPPRPSSPPPGDPGASPGAAGSADRRAAVRRPVPHRVRAGANRAAPVNIPSLTGEQVLEVRAKPAGVREEVRMGGHLRRDEPGLDPSGGLITSRMVLIVAAAVLAILPAIWFSRFDPARARPRRQSAPLPGDQTPGTPVPAAGQAARTVPSPAYKPLPPGGTRPVLAVWRLLAGEARILVQGTPLWWWLVAAAINSASLAVPASIVKHDGTSTALLLSAAWIWPALIWSRLGTQRHENGLGTLLGAYPGAFRQVAAEWAAGFALTAVAGLGPLLRMAASGDGQGVAAWIAGALFIPALALMLGTASRTHRMFQALYVILSYAAVNQVRTVNYMGTVLVNGRPAGPSPLLLAGPRVRCSQLPSLSAQRNRPPRGDSHGQEPNPSGTKAVRPRSRARLRTAADGGPGL